MKYKEIWKNIEIQEFKWLYKISSFWNVYSIWRTDSLWRKIKWRILKNDLSSKYPAIELSNNGKRKRFFIHRLVAQEFIINPYNKPQINHKNWVKTDNRVENLEWCTSSENNFHSFHILKNRVLPYTWKSVLQFSLKWEFLRKFKCIQEAKIHLWKKYIDIWRVCCWEKKTAGWFIWKLCEPTKYELSLYFR